MRIITVALIVVLVAGGLVQPQAAAASSCRIVAWNPLIKPPLPGETPVGAADGPLKALSCRNQTVSLAAVITTDQPIPSARVVFSDLTNGSSKIKANGVIVRLVGAVITWEIGKTCDPLLAVKEFPVEKSASIYAAVKVPKDMVPGLYQGKVLVYAAGRKVAENGVEIEVAKVTLPDPHGWKFFMNIWMNPAPVARWNKVPIWSDEHFRLMKPYIMDLAAHGQKTAVVPICYRPWGRQTRDSYPNSVIWKMRKGVYQFDFRNFDRYVRLYQECGIDQAIHCYSIVQGPGETRQSMISYFDEDAGREILIRTLVGDEKYVEAWGAFFKAFHDHLQKKGWLDRTYIAFDEKPAPVMEKLNAFLSKHAEGFKISLAANTRSDTFYRLDDLSLFIPFTENGVAEFAHPVPGKKMNATFYVCGGPSFPNTHVDSPIVEARMLPYLVIQGGYDGFLRWAYDDWPDNPYKDPSWGSIENPEWGLWPTGDPFFVYPGVSGPNPSLRWEQLREGIEDYELAMIAKSHISGAEDQKTFDEAIALACRNVDGKKKSVDDITAARRVLIRLAERQ